MREKGCVFAYVSLVCLARGKEREAIQKGGEHSRETRVIVMSETSLCTVFVPANLAVVMAVVAVLAMVAVVIVVVVVS